MSVEISCGSINLTNDGKSDSSQDTFVFKRVSVDLLQPGLVLSHAVYGEDNLKLIAGGIPIDELMLHRLKARGVAAVMVEKADYAKLNSEALRGTPNILICRQCDTALPLKEAADDELAMTWVCMKCKAKCRGHLDIDASKDLIDRIRIAKFHIDRSRLLHASDTVAKSDEGLVSKRYTGPERRASPRMTVSVPVAAIPVDEHYCPVGAPLILTTRNISKGGISLAHDEPLMPKFLIIELAALDENAAIQLVVQVLRCRPLGSTYEIAGKFVMRAAD